MSHSCLNYGQMCKPNKSIYFDIKLGHKVLSYYEIVKSLCASYSDESRGILERGPYPRYSILLHPSCVWLECKGYRVRNRWFRYLLMWCYTLLMLSVIVIRCCHSHIVGAMVISCLWNNLQMLIFSVLVKYFSVKNWMSLQRISAWKIYGQNVYLVYQKGVYFLSLNVYILIHTYVWFLQCFD